MGRAGRERARRQFSPTAIAARFKSSFEGGASMMSASVFHLVDRLSERDAPSAALNREQCSCEREFACYVKEIET